MVQSTTRMEDAPALLAESERRFLLYQLAENKTASIDDLLPRIAAWSHDVHPADVDEETRHRVYVSLVHNHLPRLADYDVIDYDLRSGDVVLDEGFEDVRPLLEQFRQTESVSELRQRPPL